MQNQHERKHFCDEGFPGVHDIFDEIWWHYATPIMDDESLNKWGAQPPWRKRWCSSPPDFVHYHCETKSKQRPTAKDTPTKGPVQVYTPVREHCSPLAQRSQQHLRQYLRLVHVAGTPAACCAKGECLPSACPARYFSIDYPELGPGLHKQSTRKLHRTWDGSTDVSPRPGVPAVVWTGASRTTPLDAGPHSDTDPDPIPWPTRCSTVRSPTQPEGIGFKK